MKKYKSVSSPNNHRHTGNGFNHGLKEIRKIRLDVMNTKKHGRNMKRLDEDNLGKSGYLKNSFVTGST